MAKDKPNEQSNVMREKVVQARRKAVPLVAISTVDEYVLEASISEWLTEFSKERNGGSKPGPILGWDCIRGIYGINDPGRALETKLKQEKDAMFFANPVDLLAFAFEGGFPAEKRKKSDDSLETEGTVLIMRGAHRLMGSGPIQQAVTNLRDPFKGSGRQLYLLGPGFEFPIEVSRCLHVLDDPLPDEKTRSDLVIKMHEDNGVKAPGEEVMKQVVMATRGLSLFTSEQSVSLATRQGKLEPPLLWERWRRAVNSVAGLTVDESGLTLDDIGGLDAMKDFAGKLMNGRTPPDAIVRIEEIEKALAGSSGSASDTSGVSQGILQALLTWMQEKKARGFIAVGPPGAGKSLASVTIGSAGPVPTITLDLGALKGQYVGQSERQTRDALKTIEAMARRTFWVASCNSQASLPPELKRRFKSGIWYFDLPTRVERLTIWKMYIKKFKLDPKQDLPDDRGWTGAEIESCCDTAYNFNIPIVSAAKWIVPVCRTAKELIEQLRAQASGRWLSATTGEAYTIPGPEDEPKTGTRKLDFA